MDHLVRALRNARAVGASKESAARPSATANAIHASLPTRRVVRVACAGPGRAEQRAAHHPRALVPRRWKRTPATASVPASPLKSPARRAAVARAFLQMAERPTPALQMPRSTQARRTRERPTPTLQMPRSMQERRTRERPTPALQMPRSTQARRTRERTRRRRRRMRAVTRRRRSPEQMRIQKRVPQAWVARRRRATAEMGGPREAQARSPIQNRRTTLAVAAARLRPRQVTGGCW
jgi:hypothetical protein